MKDNEIAQKVLDLMQEHEESWNSETEEYNKGHLWRDSICPFLETVEETSAFALTLKRFGWQYTNDVEDICRQVAARA